MRSAPIVLSIVAGALALLGLAIPPWILPPIETLETGAPGTGLAQLRDADRQLQYAALPVPLDPADNTDSPLASEIYENVQILGNLTDAEFTRLMLAITEWVSPVQGCEYCHDLTSEEGFASDALYTKVVSRTMLRMVQHINAQWAEHVAPSGVTCYTCHRGENVPPALWYSQNEPTGDQFLGKPQSWHLEAASITEFFSDVPYSQYLQADPLSANIESRTPFPGPDSPGTTVEGAENLYIFMMQMSESLGVNCTYCHNSRSFQDWTQSTPFRWIAYWGIRMARDINVNYIEPLAAVLPDNRKGPLGDPGKANCGTCHHGNNKPLGGYNLLEHYLAGLTVDGQPPDPGPKQAIILGEAVPVAQAGPDAAAEQPAVVAPPIAEDAIEQSVEPAGEGTGLPPAGEPDAPAADPTLGGTVTPTPAAPADPAPAPPGPSDAPSPDGSAPQAPVPGSPEVTPEASPAPGAPEASDAPSMGQPPSNPLPVNPQPGPAADPAPTTIVPAPQN
ncbi:photosynthetic reaction center cytochrome PufC [Aurantimonas endophytica]|uniref:Photosynthetic reaction center cytochrome c subunit n=1 Tax=Aurantimonas endophytica TaxID=1522175 RepID=A0A7W6MNJ0_9HYPH|nr:photosynthetic reaction center cytochrome PufC [Aurantimonas endophytica]MBB4001925.1 photosynthetic reaction center cytochrome c subunit [Aurantimonas endophytica]MCO6402442.1 photosynthetic reaction center cytochrome c subunit [Aurantimonas endophytica]